MTAHKHAKLMTRYAELAQETETPWEHFDVLDTNGRWRTLHPNLWFIPNNEYREKPKPKVVDMSVLINTGIDCVFFDYEYTFENGQKRAIEHLFSVDGKDFYRDINKGLWKYCQPRIDYWFSSAQFDGDFNTSCLVKQLRQTGFEVETSSLSGTLTAFRISGLQDNYVWPWEV